MFKERPRHVPTYWCAKYEPTDPEEKEYWKRMFEPPNVIDHRAGE